MDHLSYSSMSLYAGCGEKYRLSYVEQIDREPQGAFLGGIAVHRTIEDIENWGRATDELFFTEDFEGPSDATKVFNEHLLTLVEEVEPDEIRWGGRKSKVWPKGQDLGWWMEYGPGMVSRYHTLRKADELAGFEVLPEYTEAEVNALLPSGMRLTTRLDAVLTGPSGLIFMRDYKTGQTRVEQKLQQVLYAWAFEQTIGTKVEAAQLAYLSTANAPELVQFPVHELMPAVLDWAAEVEKGIAAEVFPLSPSSYCGSCNVRAGCAWGSTL